MAEPIPRPESPKFFGKYPGRVKDNEDPEHRGRLRVTVPQVHEHHTVWAVPCVPYAGKDRGFFAMPDIDTGVWIEFQAGDKSHPIWTGCFWSDGDIPAADATPEIKFFKTKKFTLRIDDSVGEVTIENESGSQIVLTAQDVTVKSSTVKTEATGGKKTELSAVSFSVNDGALEVL